MSSLMEAAHGGEHSWDPVHRYNALYAQGALGDDLPTIAHASVHLKTMAKVPPKKESKPSWFAGIAKAFKNDIDKIFNKRSKKESPLAKTEAPACRDVPSAHEYTYDPVARYNALVATFKQPRGTKAQEHLEVLRTSNPSLGSLAPRRDRPSVHEITYDPIARYVAIAPSLRLPRGFKSLEHLEILRTSNPTFGSLAPRRDRPSAHEITMDPVARFNLLALSLKLPRGFKDAKHLEILRTSNPTYGSLAPRRDRPSAHEITFDPVARYAATASTLRLPRGTKSIEHLEVLRTSDPTFGSLAPRRDRPSAHELPYDPIERYVAMVRARGLERLPRGSKSVEHLASLRLSRPRPLPSSETSSFSSFEEYSFSDQDSGSDEVLDGLSSLAKPHRPRRLRVERVSNTSDASELSCARTAERASNSSEAAFLQEYAELGEKWPTYAGPGAGDQLSSPHLKSSLGLGLGHGHGLAGAKSGDFSLPAAIACAEHLLDGE